MYDADLGPVTLANRVKLSQVFTGAVKESTLRVAAEKGCDPAEPWRLVDEAMSLVTDINFLGQSSTLARPRRREGESGPAEVDPAAKKKHTMPIRLSFEDRDARIFFERTLREKSDMRAVQSLPRELRRQQSMLYETARRDFPDHYINIRTCATSLCFVIKKRLKTGGQWENLRMVIIDPQTMVSGSVPATAGLGDGGDAMTV